MRNWLEEFGKYPRTQQDFGAVVNDPSGRAVVYQDLVPAAEQFKADHPSCPYSVGELINAVIPR